MGLLLLARHGQASFAAQDYDVLSDLGRRQAELLGVRLRPYGLVRVVTGGLRRQRDTAVHAALGVTPEVDPRWDEYDASAVVAPVLRQGTDLTDRHGFQTALDEALARWTGGAHDRDYAEPWPAFRARVRAGLADALAGPAPLLVVSSGGPVALVVAELLGLSAAGWAAVSRTSVNSGLAKVVTGRSGTSLLTVNDHAHLEAEPGLVSYR